MHTCQGVLLSVCWASAVPDTSLCYYLQQVHRQETDPWYLGMRQIAVPSYVHLLVDLPEQIFSLTLKGSSSLHHLPHVQLDHLSATQLGTLQRWEQCFLETPTLVTFRSPVASSAAARLKLMLFGFLVLSFSRTLINWQIVSHCSSTRRMTGPILSQRTFVCCPKVSISCPNLACSCW